MVYITSSVSLWYRPCYEVMLKHDKDNKCKNLRQYKSRFSLIVEQMRDFASSTSLVWEVKNLIPNFKQIA